MRMIYNHKLGVAVQLANIKSITLEGKHDRAILLNTPYGYRTPGANSSIVWIDDKIIFFGDLPDCQKVAAGIIEFMADEPEENILDVNELLQAGGE